jgi:hypothetical protein
MSDVTSKLEIVTAAAATDGTAAKAAITPITAIAILDLGVEPGAVRTLYLLHHRCFRASQLILGIGCHFTPVEVLHRTFV